MNELTRSEELAQKLFLDENIKLSTTIKSLHLKSEDYANMMIEKYGFNKTQTTKEGFKLLYMLNHICPSLYHFHKMPTPHAHYDLKTYNELSQKHFLENTQAGLMSNGVLIQKGVEYSKEEYDKFIDMIITLI